LKPEEKEFLLLETSVMRVLDHPHVIKLIDTIETKSIIYIITEIVKDGDLFDFIINNEYLEGKLT
jgi:serine/threonine protein kinase